MANTTTINTTREYDAAVSELARLEARDINTVLPGFRAGRVARMAELRAALAGVDREDLASREAFNAHRIKWDAYIAEEMRRERRIG